MTPDLRHALHQLAEADRILGASDWPISRAVLQQPAASPASRPPIAANSAVGSAPRIASTASSTPLRTQDSGLRTSPSPANPQSSIPSPPFPADRALALQALDTNFVRGCTKCGLCKSRTQTVFGQGNPHARIVFVGEAPGFDEDRTGQAFVGRAGQLLTAMIERGMGLKRDEVFICNVLKCRPPENRTPAPDEIVACSPYLFEQLRIIQPEIIVALGAPASQTLLATRESIGRLRGRFHDFRLPGDELTGVPPIPLMPTYHPAYLLRTPADKSKAWEDLKKVLTHLGLPIPGQ